MKLLITRFSFLFLIFFSTESSILYAQSSQTPKEQKNFQSLEELSDLTTLNSSSEKIILKLRYSHYYGNFLVFYDKNNFPIFLQYRHEKFDHENDHVKNRISRGIPFLAKISFLGIQEQIPKPFDQAIDLAQKKTTEKEKLSSAKSLPNFQIRKPHGVFIGILYDLHYLSARTGRF